MPHPCSPYLISDRRCLPPGVTLAAAVEQALAGGVRAVQLREKDLGAAALLHIGQQLRAITRRYNARLLINDRVDIALALDADGVHLGEQSMDAACARRLLGADKLIVVSTHNLAGAQRAQQQGADFITFSPIYATASKAAYGAPQGLDKLRRVCASVELPVFALGGITASRVGSVYAAGASGIAVISAILARPDICQAARDLSDFP